MAGELASHMQGTVHNSLQQCDLVDRVRSQVGWYRQWHGKPGVRFINEIIINQLLLQTDAVFQCGFRLSDGCAGGQSEGMFSNCIG